MSAAGFLRPLLERGRPRVLQDLQTGLVIAHSVDTAFDSASRRKGLLGRSGLEHGEALVIAPCGGVHTFGMRFPIDVVFTSKDGRVVGVRERLLPRRVALSWRAFATIELPAGAIERLSIAPGHVLSAVTVP